MSENHGSFEQKLERLCHEYMRLLPIKIHQISDAVEQLDMVQTTPDKWKDLRRLVHGLAGSGSTFGFEALSKQAKILENMILESQKPPVQAWDTCHAALKAQVNQLRDALLMRNSHQL